eukprot:scaffold11.g3864.t1
MSLLRSAGGSGGGGGKGGSGGSGGSGGGGGGGSGGGLPGGLWAGYLALLDRQPLATKAITAAALNGLGDVIAQLQFEKDGAFNWRRLGVFAFLGLVLIGPALHAWYGKLGVVVKATGTKGAAIMALEGHAADAPAKLRADLPTMVRSNWLLWVPFQFVNFRWVPPQLQARLLLCDLPSPVCVSHPLLESALPSVSGILQQLQIAVMQATACEAMAGVRPCRVSAHALPSSGTRRWPQQQPTAQRSLRVRAAAVEDEEVRVDNSSDLWQFPDREQWYLPKFAADDQPDWNPARFVRSRDLAPGVREVVVEVEIRRAGAAVWACVVSGGVAVGRERVPLRNAYKHEAVVAAPPFPLASNKDVLVKLRGDLIANATKSAVELESVPAELPLLVRQDEQPELYKLSEEDVVEAGAFEGAGLDLRGPIASIFSFPTVVIFAEGYGIATAKALIEATSDVGGLNFGLRSDVRMYYRAPNEAALCYKELYETWERDHGCKVRLLFAQVIASTRGTFSDMFDDDDTLMYEPASTAAIILTGGDEEAEAAAAEVCKDAEIATLVLQSQEQEPTKYLSHGKPKE